MAFFTFRTEIKGSVNPFWAVINITPKNSKPISRQLHKPRHLPLSTGSGYLVLGWEELNLKRRTVFNMRLRIATSLTSQNQSSSDGPVAILWDIENCPVPSDVRPEDVAGNIRMALRVHPVIKGAVMMFSAYGDFNSFPRRLREGCQRTGVKLIDVPNGRKDAADKAILVDMFLFALDNRPPSSIMLISGDVDFAPALHILGQRGVARGEGFVPPAKVFDASSWSILISLDIKGLKAQMVKLLELSGGCLPLIRVPAEYQKLFGRPLYVSEYGAYKLVNLFKKLGETMAIEGRGQRKFVYLRNWKAGPSAILARKDKNVKGSQEESMNISGACGSSDELSDDERVVVEEQDVGRNQSENKYGDAILAGFSWVCFEAIYQQRYKRALDYHKFGVDQLEELLEKVSDVVALHEEPVSKRKFLVAVGG
ncbi:hypothetical protein Patl1_36116 [Pistacia atlantica]|nr:hypothetical protein Patl1_36116 [Pistacia atlantica]